MRESRYDWEKRQKEKKRRRCAQLTGQILAVCVLLAAVAVITVILPGHFGGAVSHTAETGGGEAAGLVYTESGTNTGEAQNSQEGSGDLWNDQDTEAGDEDWLLLLVNRDHPLPDGYQVELTQLDNGKSVDSRIYPALQQMFDDARASGIYPIVASGYRTAEDQQRIMNEKIQEFVNQGYSQDEAEQEALNWVAVPGTSEHQLGSAVDINADGIHSYGDQVYEWLNENGWRYGFIQRYPLDKTEITGISYEPWHYRYVGEQAAKEIYDQGLCLEEYLGEA